MIRIYLDWDIISKLKHDCKLFDFFKKHKRSLQFPYSPAHFSDLMKSFGTDNKLFYVDLENLEFLTDNHFLMWEGNKIEIGLHSPKSYFDNIKVRKNYENLFDIETAFNFLKESAEEHGLEDLVTALTSAMHASTGVLYFSDYNKDFISKIFPNLSEESSFWDLLKDIGVFQNKILKDKVHYTDLRESVGKQGMRINPCVAGNWAYDEVFKNIDAFLTDKGIKMKFIEYVISILNYKQEKYNIFEFYTTAYLMFDLIGFKKDTLPKSTDNMRNIITDSEHSFYGAHCDYFVVKDKNLKIRSKALYKELNISTKICDPDEIVEELEKALYDIDKDENMILVDALNYCNEQNLIEFISQSKELNIKTYVFKLPEFYFNFFNYVVLEKYLNEKIFVLTFKKAFKNLSRFVYHTEMLQIIDDITNIFGFDNITERNDIKQKLVYETEDISFEWHFNEFLVLLTRDSDTRRPILQFIFNYNI